MYKREPPKGKSGEDIQAREREPEPRCGYFNMRSFLEAVMPEEVSSR